MQIWIGTSGFQYKEWKGKFYPADLSEAKMLAYYAERFPSTEVNYTFRHLPSAKAIARWEAATPERFRFSCKAPQSVTHFARLRDCTQKIAVFHQAISPLGKKLGPVLFQLPPNLAADLPLLREFLSILPRGLRAAFEFRHPSWFSPPVYGCLRKARAALCIAEDEELASPAVATAAYGYLRLRREDYRPKDLQRWAAWVAAQASKWRDAYIYLKHEETELGPKFARALQKELGVLPRRES